MRAQILMRRVMGFWLIILIGSYWFLLYEATGALLKSPRSPAEQQGMIQHQILLQHPDLRSDVHGRLGHHHVTTAGYDHRAHGLSHTSKVCR